MKSAKKVAPEDYILGVLSPEERPKALPPVSPKRFDPGLLQVFSVPFDSVHDSLGNTLIKPRQVAFSLRSKFDRVFHRLPPKAEFFGDLSSRNTFLSLSFRLKRTS